MPHLIELNYRWHAVIYTLASAALCLSLFDPCMVSLGAAILVLGGLIGTASMIRMGTVTIYDETEQRQQTKKEHKDQMRAGITVVFCIAGLFISLFISMIYIAIITIQLINCMFGPCNSSTITGSFGPLFIFDCWTSIYVAVIFLLLGQLAAQISFLWRMLHKNKMWHSLYIHSP